MGCRGSEVRILSPRPFFQGHLFPDRAGSSGTSPVGDRPKRYFLPGECHLSRSTEGHPPPGARASLHDEAFRLLVEAVSDYAIFLLDPSGHVVSWNRGAERLKGYSRDEILGRHISVFYPDEAVERHWPQHELE